MTGSPAVYVPFLARAGWGRMVRWWGRASGERRSEGAVAETTCKEPAVGMLSLQTCSDCEPTAGSLRADSGGEGEGRGPGRGERGEDRGHDSERKRATAER
jgi:hypothetical protein